MVAPYLHRCLKAPGVEMIMFTLCVIALFGMIVGTFTSETLSAAGGLSTIIVIFYMLLISVAPALEFKFWRWWARNRIQITDRHHSFTKIDTIDEKRLWFNLTDEVAEWVKENCRGRVVVIPEVDPMWRRVVAFSDPDDAFHFKMRWL